ncbi:hypothetical protein CTI12_AA411240 [Artemisia annua]|uniref:Uncharacterized protein n=1 Tax=Artemisia annua TaxID=35608 RepID=A0A2U1M7I2_ARTAN|nr:hypothetical protein CTI12_AA411240 [Artemisia annua]
MISILAQERVLGAALGTAFTGFIVFQQRKDIYDTIAKSQPKPPKSQMKEPNLGKKSQFDIAHYWNKAVDRAFGPAIQELGSRRW